jgi:hypothetical protein
MLCPLGNRIPIGMGKEDRPNKRGPPISGSRWEEPGGERSDARDPHGSEYEHKWKGSWAGAVEY